MKSLIIAAVIASMVSIVSLARIAVFKLIHDINQFID